MNKYKLINTKTKEEHLCDKVTIDGFDYYVSDGEIIVNDYYLNVTLQKIQKSINGDYLKGIYENYKKVIATNNPNIDIPKVMNEVEELAYNWLYDNETENKANQGYPLKPMEYGFIKGYNKAQETHPFSEKNMIEFSEWKDYNFYQHIEDNLYRTMQARPMYKVLENKSYTTKELLQLWKEQQPKKVYYE